MNNQIERYKALEAQEATKRKGSAEHIAYAAIVQALMSEDPALSIQKRIEKAHAELAHLDQANAEGRFHGDPDRPGGYRDYYRTIISLLQEALDRVGN